MSATQKLGRYEILGELGRGAMGVVYLARDPIIGRKVALKTFRLGYSAQDRELEQFRARFLREAQSAGILSHPNIVTIHDVVEDSSGAFFIAMEYVRGTDLKQLMQRHARLEASFVIDLVAQVAEGLDYAHEKGVVHRDIKPANVIVTARKEAKITDFGIARIDASNLTVEGQLLGTPNYMAPEQIRGKEVDHRADLFSLGVMLYEMLTGHKPFAGDNLTVVTHRIVYDSFTPPEELGTELSAPILSILGRALAKNPEDRYARGADLARELRALLNGGAQAAPEPAAGSYLPPSQEAQASTASSQALPAIDGPAASPPPASQAASTPPPSTAAPTPAPPARRVSFLGLPPWPRTLAIAALALVLGLGAARLAGIFWAPDDGLPWVTNSRAVLEQRQLALRDVQEARRRLEAGESAIALESLERALVRLPGNSQLQTLRDEVERDMLDLGDLDAERAYVERRLGGAREALEQRDYRRALILAEEALNLVPKDDAALELQRQAQEGLERRRLAQTRLSGGASGRGRSGDTPAPAATNTSPSSRSAISETPLQVVLESALPEGRLTIYQGQDTLLKRSFSFEGERGVFGRRKSRGGRLEEALTVPARQLSLKIYLWRKAGGVQGTERAEVEADFSDGRARVLRLDTSAEGDLSARLEEAPEGG